MTLPSWSRTKLIDGDHLVFGVDLEGSANEVGIAVRAMAPGALTDYLEAMPDWIRRHWVHDDSLAAVVRTKFASTANER